MIFSIAAHIRLYIKQTDVDRAFLYPDLTEGIYMEQPRGFERYGNMDPMARNWCADCGRTAVFDLKQAPRNWHKLPHEYTTSQHY